MKMKIHDRNWFILILLLFMLGACGKRTGNTLLRNLNSDDSFIFLGTVIDIENSPLPQSPSNWIVEFRIDKIISGAFQGDEFSIRIHSPAKSGLDKGEKYHVQAKRTDNGYIADQYQWIKNNVNAEPVKPASLSEIVFFGIRPVRELRQGNDPGTGQACVRKYLDAIPANSRLWLADVPSGPEDAVLVRRRNLVEQIVTVMGENTREEAEAFASAVPLLAEWESMSEGPVAEADFVDQWLGKRPETSIAPFLHLFKAHRLRAGYEAARAGREKGLWPILARLYRESIGKARSSANPLISCIADDLEAQTHVYLAGYGRP